MKTVVEQLEDAQAENKTLQASIIMLNQAALGDVAKVEALAAQVKALTDEKGALVAAHEAALIEVNGKLSAETEAHAVTVTALAEANKKLADPAYKLASAEGDKTAVPEGGAPAAETVSIIDRLQAIKDPQEKRAFYLKNEAEIKAALN